MPILLIMLISSLYPYLFYCFHFSGISLLIPLFLAFLSYFVIGVSLIYLIEFIFAVIQFEHIFKENYAMY